MSEAQADPKAPGWKRDPSGRFDGRYWDGTGWTEHVVKQGVRSSDPVPPRPPTQLRPEPVATAEPVAAEPLTARPAPPAPPAPARPGPAAPRPQRPPAPAPRRPVLAKPSPSARVPPPPTRARRQGDDRRRQAAYLLLGAAAAVAIGTFLPWASVRAPGFGASSRSGIERDGIVFLCLAATLGLLAFDLRRPPPDRASSLRWVVAALLGILALLTVVELVDVKGRFRGVVEGTAHVQGSRGIGLWLVAVAVGVAWVGWARMPWEPSAGGKRPAS